MSAYFVRTRSTTMTSCGMMSIATNPKYRPWWTKQSKIQKTWRKISNYSSYSRKSLICHWRQRERSGLIQHQVRSHVRHLHDKTNQSRSTDEYCKEYGFKIIQNGQSQNDQYLNGRNEETEEEKWTIGYHQHHHHTTNHEPTHMYCSIVLCMSAA